jgi:hypothetical protein
MQLDRLCMLLGLDGADQAGELCKHAGVELVDPMSALLRKTTELSAPSVHRKVHDQ